MKQSDSKSDKIVATEATVRFFFVQAVFSFRHIRTEELCEDKI